MIYIFIRRTTDWGRIDVVESQLPRKFRQKVEVWDSIFNIPYFAFRDRLKQIAQLNLARVKGVTCVTDWDDIPESALVVPVDDDDWFSPELGPALERALTPGIAGYYWNSHFVQVPIHFGHTLGLIRRRLFPGTPPKFLCTTNNYAMVKSPGMKDLCQYHSRASRWFLSHPERVLKLDLDLSLMNRTLASQTSLAFNRSSVSASYVIRKYKKYKKLYTMPVPGELAWAEGYMSMVAELMDELEPRGAS